MMSNPYTEMLEKNQMTNLLKRQSIPNNYGKPPKMPNYTSLENDITMLKKSILQKVDGQNYPMNLTVR